MKDLLQAPIFSGFFSWKDIAYQKEITPKILRFEVQDQDQARPLYLTSIISKEEKMAWQSFQEFLEHATGFAQKGMRGFFGLDVLCADIQSGMQNFNPNDLVQLVLNHSKKLGPDQRALIRYGQFYALLHYRAPADWGKVEVRTHAEFVEEASAHADAESVDEASVRDALLSGNPKKQQGRFDQFLKKFLKASGKEPHAVYLVQDLSVHSVWDPTQEVQQQKVRDWLQKEQQLRHGLLPEIHFFHSVTKQHGLLKI
jgi:hypothetical protein